MLGKFYARMNGAGIAGEQIFAPRSGHGSDVNSLICDKAAATENHGGQRSVHHDFNRREPTPKLRLTLVLDRPGEPSDSFS